MHPTDDDKLIWDLEVGDTLTAERDLIMEGDGTRAFTAQRRYQVGSLHPIADPPFVRVRNDQGQSHVLRAPDLRAYFGF